MSFMSIVWMVIIGVVVGYIARMLKPGDDAIGFWLTAVLGVAGSFVANFLGKALHWYKDGQAAGFIASVIGAMILLFGYDLIKKMISGGGGGSSDGGSST